MALTLRLCLGFYLVFVAFAATCDNKCPNGYCTENYKSNGDFYCTCDKGKGGKECTATEPNADSCTWASKGEFVSCTCNDGSTAGTCGDATPAEEGNVDCFDGESTVHIKGKGHVAIKHLKAGDKVLAVQADGRVTYEDVYMFSHADASVQRDDFVQIMTSSGGKMTMSPGHMVPTGNSVISMDLVKAEDVLVGSSVFTVNHEEMMTRRETITEINKIPSTGLYNPQTKSGTLVVGGIHGSCYTTAVQHVFAHNLLWPIRCLQKIAPSLSLIGYDMVEGRTWWMVPGVQQLSNVGLL